jgi:hypothetical protein
VIYSPPALVRFPGSRKALNCKPLISHLTNSNEYGNLYPKVLLTVSPARPLLSQPFRVYPRHTLFAFRRLREVTHRNFRRVTLLRTLGRREKTQLLCNQANPHSSCKTSGVGYPSTFEFQLSTVNLRLSPVSTAFTPIRALTPLPTAFTQKIRGVEGIWTASRALRVLVDLGTAASATGCGAAPRFVFP